MDNFIRQLLIRQRKASAERLRQIAGQVALALFADDLLTVDEPLWGSFWQGDVISPGYRLPAVELMLLRAVRLDQNWPPETTVSQFLADLRRTIVDPQAGVWTLFVAGHPCLVFAGDGSERLNVGRWKVLKGSSKGEEMCLRRPDKRVTGADNRMITVVWYCASTGRLHAGYRTTAGKFALNAPALKQRHPGWKTELEPSEQQPEPDWIEPVLAQRELDETAGLAARLDDEILRIRSGQTGRGR